MALDKSGGQNTVFSRNHTLNVQGRLIDLTKPRVMGILNVTPDSFFDRGQHAGEAALLMQAEKMISEGATFIDVGGYSTRPGAAEVSPEAERARVVPIIEAMRKRFGSEVLISIDTFRSSVARAAVEAGASLVNDIAAGDLDPAMPDTVAALKVPYIIMHMRGTPQTMATQTHYADLLREVMVYLQAKVQAFHAQGIHDIIVDPGFGFAKTPAQNFELLQGLEHFRWLEEPLLVGVSRKSMIWRTLGKTPEQALNGTTVLNTVAVQKGANILRVHDVAEAMEVVKLLACLPIID